MIDAQDNTERLQNLLARRGVASRRASATLIEEGKVTVNGKVVTEPGARITPGARICVKGYPLPSDEERKRTFLFYKPTNVVCSENGQGSITACSFFRRYRERLVSVGRLDKESEGLILMSNDGELINHMTHPRYEHKKHYHVTVRGRLDDRALSILRSALDIDGYKIRPVEVEVIKKGIGIHDLHFILQEGRNRQIRKMCEYAELTIPRLKRVQIADFTIGNLTPGAFRELSDDEVKALMQ